MSWFQLMLYSYVKCSHKERAHDGYMGTSYYFFNSPTRMILKFLKLTVKKKKERKPPHIMMKEEREEGGRFKFKEVFGMFQKCC